MWVKLDIVRCLTPILALLVLVQCQVDVDIEYGTIRGQEITLDDGKVVVSFKGVPFAKPPVGDLRFAVSSV